MPKAHILYNILRPWTDSLHYLSQSQFNVNNRIAHGQCFPCVYCVPLRLRWTVSWPPARFQSLIVHVTWQIPSDWVISLKQRLLIIYRVGPQSSSQSHMFSTDGHHYSPLRHSRGFSYKAPVSQPVRKSSQQRTKPIVPHRSHITLPVWRLGIS